MLVTVSILSHERPEYLPQAVDSIFSQTHKEWEIIIGDDSTDARVTGYLELLEQRHPDRVRVIHATPGTGIQARRNQILEAARGAIIAQQDDDDFSYPTRLAETVRAFESDKGIVLFSAWSDTLSGEQREPSNIAFRLSWEDDFGRHHSVHMHGGPVVAFSREAALAIGGYREDWQNSGHGSDNGAVRMGSDWDFYRRLMQRYSAEAFRFRDSILGCYRIHARNITVLDKANIPAEQPGDVIIRGRDLPTGPEQKRETPLVKAPSRALRILWFCPRYLPRMAGGETYVEGTSAVLSELGCKVAVATETAVAPGSMIARTDGRCGIVEYRCVRQGFRVSDFIREFPADIVLSQLEWVLPATMQSRSLGILNGVVVHGEHTLKHSLPADKHHLPDFYICNSFGMVDAIGNRQHTTIFPPLDMARIGAAHGKATRVGDAIVLVNGIRQKGVYIALALAQAMPDRKFIIVRGGYGEQVKDSFPNVEYVPNGPIADALHRSRIMLFPTQSESFGMAGVEAQACGLPVLAYHLESLQDSLGDGAVYLNVDSWERPGQACVEEWRKAICALDDDVRYSTLATAAMANAHRYPAIHREQCESFIMMVEAMLRTKGLRRGRN